MRRVWRFLVVALSAALVIAAVISATAAPTPYESRLLHLSAERALPEPVVRALRDESDRLNLLFIGWADDQALVFNGALALSRHDETARRMLLAYGAEPDFQRVLARYGPDALLPVAWFHDNEVRSLEVRHWAAERYRRTREAIGDWWRETEEAASDSPGIELTPWQRGRYAIAFLQADGYGFLDQFVVDEQGAIHWLQGERLAAGVSDFFTGGLRDLERRVQGGASVGPADLAWAGVDVLLMAGAVKALRAGRAVQAGTVQGRGGVAAGAELRSTRALAPAALRFTGLSRSARFAAVGATAWVVVQHPSLISGLGATLAHWLGWPVRLVQFLLWSVVLLPFFWFVGFVWRWLLRPLLWCRALLGQRRRLT